MIRFEKYVDGVKNDLMDSFTYNKILSAFTLVKEKADVSEEEGVKAFPSLIEKEMVKPLVEVYDSMVNINSSLESNIPVNGETLKMKDDIFFNGEHMELVDEDDAPINKSGLGNEFYKLTRKGNKLVVSKPKVVSAEALTLPDEEAIVTKPLKLSREFKVYSQTITGNIFSLDLEVNTFTMVLELVLINGDSLSVFFNGTNVVSYDITTYYVELYKLNNEYGFKVFTLDTNEEVTISSINVNEFIVNNEEDLYSELVSDIVYTPLPTQKIDTTVDDGLGFTTMSEDVKILLKGKSYKVTQDSEISDIIKDHLRMKIDTTIFKVGDVINGDINVVNNVVTTLIVKGEVGNVVKALKIVEDKIDDIWSNNVYTVTYNRDTDVISETPWVDYSSKLEPLNRVVLDTIKSYTDKFNAISTFVLNNYYVTKDTVLSIPNYDPYDGGDNDPNYYLRYFNMLNTSTMVPATSKWLKRNYYLLNEVVQPTIYYITNLTESLFNSFKESITTDSTHNPGMKTFTLLSTDDGVNTYNELKPGLNTKTKLITTFYNGEINNVPATNVEKLPNSSSTTIATICTPLLKHNLVHSINEDMSASLPPYIRVNTTRLGVLPKLDDNTTVNDHDTRLNTKADLSYNLGDVSFTSNHQPTLVAGNILNMNNVSDREGDNLMSPYVHKELYDDIEITNGRRVSKLATKRKHVKRFKGVYSKHNAWNSTSVYEPDSLPVLTNGGVFLPKTNTLHETTLLAEVHTWLDSSFIDAFVKEDGFYLASTNSNVMNTNGAYTLIDLSIINDRDGSPIDYNDIESIDIVKDGVFISSKHWRLYAGVGSDIINRLGCNKTDTVGAFKLLDNDNLTYPINTSNFTYTNNSTYYIDNPTTTPNIYISSNMLDNEDFLHESQWDDMIDNFINMVVGYGNNKEYILIRTTTKLLYLDIDDNTHNSIGTLKEFIFEEGFHVGLISGLKKMGSDSAFSFLFKGKKNGLFVYGYLPGTTDLQDDGVLVQDIKIPTQVGYFKDVLVQDVHIDVDTIHVIMNGSHIVYIACFGNRVHPTAWLSNSFKLLPTITPIRKFHYGKHYSNLFYISLYGEQYSYGTARYGRYESKGGVMDKGGLNINSVQNLYKRNSYDEMNLFLGRNGKPYEDLTEFSFSLNTVDNDYITETLNNIKNNVGTVVDMGAIDNYSRKLGVLDSYVDNPYRNTMTERTSSISNGYNLHVTKPLSYIDDTDNLLWFNSSPQIRDVITNLTGTAHICKCLVYTPSDLHFTYYEGMASSIRITGTMQGQPNVTRSFPYNVDMYKGWSTHVEVLIGDGTTHIRLIQTKGWAYDIIPSIREDSFETVVVNKDPYINKQGNMSHFIVRVEGETSTEVITQLAHDLIDNILERE